MGCPNTGNRLVWPTGHHARGGHGDLGWGWGRGEPGSLNDCGTDLPCPLLTALCMDEKEASVTWAPVMLSTQSRVHCGGRSRLIKRWEGFGKQKGVHWNQVYYLLSARPCTGCLTRVITTNFHKLGGMYYYHMHCTDEEKRLSEFLVQVTELKSVKLDWILSYSGSGLFSLAFLLCCSQEWNGLLENVLCRAEFRLLNYLPTHS